LELYDGVFLAVTGLVNLLSTISIGLALFTANAALRDPAALCNVYIIGRMLSFR